jgi:hypothetical protein
MTRRFGALGSAYVVMATALVLSASIQAVAGSVRFIYLVPADRSVSQDKAEAIATAAGEARVWFAGQMSGGATFALHDPVVEVFKTTHTASWYSEGCPDSEEWCFWYRVKDEAAALAAGVGFDDVEHVWVVYIDAEPVCGQAGGGAGGGVVILPRHDLEGVSGYTGVRYQCGEVETRGVDRWIGGLAHELGHAFGLPHPPECEDDDPSTACSADCLMFSGYASFPATYLLDVDKAQLSSCGFFTDVLDVSDECSYALQLGDACWAFWEIDELLAETYGPPWIDATYRSIITLNRNLLAAAEQVRDLLADGGSLPQLHQTVERACLTYRESPYTAHAQLWLDGQIAEGNDAFTERNTALAELFAAIQTVEEEARRACAQVQIHPWSSH